MVDGVWIGAAFGAVHGIVAAMAMPMMSAMHPRVSGGARTAEAPSGEVVLPPFGFGGKNFGRATPVGLWMAHIVFGAAWGIVFAALI